MHLKSAYSFFHFKRFVNIIDVFNNLNARRSSSEYITKNKNGVP